jgi:molecular chaperone GrpE
MSEEKSTNETVNEENKVNETVNETTETNQTTNETSTETDNTSAPEVDTPEKKLAELNDKYLRLYSEFDNYRKRTNKEKLDLISTASSSVLKDMLTILDDFERAIANNEQVEDITAVKEGFNLIHNKFKNILEGKGLKQMNAKGEVFDSELHEAIANVPAPSEDLKGKIIDDVEKGYYLNEKVIRFAKVVVGN